MKPLPLTALLSASTCGSAWASDDKAVAAALGLLTIILAVALVVGANRKESV